MNKKAYICHFNMACSCDCWKEGHHLKKDCSRCGWNPEVSKARAAEIQKRFEALGGTPGEDGGEDEANAVHIL